MTSISKQISFVAGILLVIGILFGASMVYLHHVFDSKDILNAKIVQSEGLMLPTISDSPNAITITIYHQGSRRLNPITIEHWSKLEGVINVKEVDYGVEITRSPNFNWYQIFHPEEYIPGYAQK